MPFSGEGEGPRPPRDIRKHRAFGAGLWRKPRDIDKVVSFRQPKDTIQPVRDVTSLSEYEEKKHTPFQRAGKLAETVHRSGPTFSLKIQQYRHPEDPSVAKRPTQPKVRDLHGSGEPQNTGDSQSYLVTKTHRSEDATDTKKVYISHGKAYEVHTGDDGKEALHPLDYQDYMHLLEDIRVRGIPFVHTDPQTAVANQYRDFGESILPDRLGEDPVVRLPEAEMRFTVWNSRDEGDAGEGVQDRNHVLRTFYDEAGEPMEVRWSSSRVREYPLYYHYGPTQNIETDEWNLSNINPPQFYRYRDLHAMNKISQEQRDALAASMVEEKEYEDKMRKQGQRVAASQQVKDGLGVLQKRIAQTADEG